jgi:hypothetical protein
MARRSRLRKFVFAAVSALVLVTVSLLVGQGSAHPSPSACKPVHVFSQSPAGFDPAKATDAQLEKYGFPPRPPGASPHSSAYRVWLKAVESGATFVRPHPVCGTGSHGRRGDAGFVVGAIYRVGGPPTVRPQPREAGEVSVFTAGGRLIARQQVRSGRRFRFRLWRGHYWLNAGWRLHPRRDAPYYDCQPLKTGVRADRTAHTGVGYGCYWK